MENAQTEVERLTKELEQEKLLCKMYREQAQENKNKAIQLEGLLNLISKNYTNERTC